MFFEESDTLAPDALAGLAGLDPAMIKRAIVGGCPTERGLMSLAGYRNWLREFAHLALPEFAVGLTLRGGYYCEKSRYWVVRPAEEWVLDGDESRLAVGGPGVDGIDWVLLAGQSGVFVHYPIDNETYRCSRAHVSDYDR